MYHNSKVQFVANENNHACDKHPYHQHQQSTNRPIYLIVVDEVISYKEEHIGNAKKQYGGY